MAMKMKMITQLIIGQVLMIVLTFQVGAIVADYLPVESAATQVLPGCTSKCGNVEIPYPFGIGNSTKSGHKPCSLESKFELNCSTDSKLYVGSVQVLNIDILKSQMDVLFFTSQACGTEEANTPKLHTAWLSISSEENKFVTVGRDSYGYFNIFENDGSSYSTGCLTRIGDRKFKKGEDDGTCSGRGCCEVEIPPRVTNISIKATFFPNSTQALRSCSYSFIVKKDKYSFKQNNLRGTFPFDLNEVPVVLDWTIGKKSCSGVSKSICGNNSYCYDSDNKDTSYGYRCKCLSGLEGNPYLPGGCTDINECVTPNHHRCESVKYCFNTFGNHTCICPKGQSGNGIGKGGCQPNGNGSLRTILGVGAAAIVLFVGALSYIIYEKRKFIKLKEKFFHQNGGTLLQQKLDQRKDSSQVAQIFTENQLKKATNNFDDNLIVGRGGFGTVFKGYLADHRIVAIKKSKIIDESQIEQFINEVDVVSQINHRNVVKLLGCCLETQVPLLVYEFVNNGTLSDYIHKQGFAHIATWKTRLKIATEVAGALSYLHSAASIPIIHRDVKSANILLDDTYTAKVSDFGASRLVPLDQTEVATMVQGTIGYLDPEYMQTSQLNEKSDVYSFGVVLVELITGKRPFCFSRSEHERSLSMHFLSCLRNACLSDVVQDGIKNEENEQEIMEVAILASRCLRLKGEERPCMKEVAMELEGMRLMEKHSWSNSGQNIEETRYLLCEGSTSIYKSGDSSIYGFTGYDSLKNHVSIAMDDGR